MSSFSDLIDAYFRFIGKFIPEEKQEIAVSLDISDSVVRTTQIMNEGNDYYLINWGIEPIENDDPGEAIKRLLSRLNIDTTGAFSSLFGRGTLIRYIDMPRMPYKELKQAFTFEVDKYFPFPPESIYFDCFPLDPKGKGAKMPVLVAAAKREIVDQRLEALTNAGLHVDLVGVNAIASANAYQVLHAVEEDADKAIALLDIGENVSNLLVVQGGLPQFSRDIYVGTKEMIKRLVNTLGVSEQEAKLTLQTPGADAQAVAMIYESVLTNLMGEIRMSMEYFMTEKNLSIEKIYLLGSGARMHELDQQMQEHFSMSVEFWNPLQTLQVAETAPPGVEEYIHELIPSIGLSLYQYDKN